MISFSFCCVHSCILLSQWVNIFSDFSHHLVDLSFHIMAIFRRGPPNGASNAGGVGKNRDSRSLSGFIACCQWCDRQMLYTQLRRTVASWWHSSLVSGVVCCSRETGDKFMTRSLNVTPKTTEQSLIVRSDKSVAYATNNNRLYSTVCTIEANYWQTRSIARPLCDSRATCNFGSWVTAKCLLTMSVLYFIHFVISCLLNYIK